MKQYKLVDNIFGWVAFIIAAFVYCSTIEPTASFWDCPEFITTAYKQEIGHPPGAPFFMLLGNFFTHGEHDERTPQCRLHHVPFLDHHPFGSQTHHRRLERDDNQQDDSHRSIRYGGRTHLYLQRYLLVLSC